MGRPVELNPSNTVRNLVRCEADIAVRGVALVQGVLVVGQLEEVTPGKSNVQCNRRKVSIDPKAAFASAFVDREIPSPSPAIPHSC
jgi:hypothetical protein